MEGYQEFIDEQEKIVREYMPAGAYVIREVPKDMLPLLSKRFSDLKTETTLHEGELATFVINIDSKQHREKDSKIKIPLSHFLER